MRGHPVSLMALGSRPISQSISTTKRSGAFCFSDGPWGQDDMSNWTASQLQPQPAAISAASCPYVCTLTLSCACVLIYPALRCAVSFLFLRFYPSNPFSSSFPLPVITAADANAWLEHPRRREMG